MKIPNDRFYVVNIYLSIYLGTYLSVCLYLLASQTKINTNGFTSF